MSKRKMTGKRAKLGTKKKKRRPTTIFKTQIKNEHNTSRRDPFNHYNHNMVRRVGQNRQKSTKQIQIEMDFRTIFNRF